MRTTGSSSYGTMGTHESDNQAAPSGDVESNVQRRLEPRHLQMIAIGGTIGTGLFLGSGATVAYAGPLGSLVSYVLVSIMVFFVVTSLGEMAALVPISGSFSSYAGRYVDPSLQFTLGWSYWLQWAVSLPAELSALGLIVQFWTPNIQAWIWSGVALVLLLAINLFSVRGFGETEYWLSAIKIVTVCIFIIVGIVLNAGGIPGQAAVGFSYWAIDGAPFKDGFSGIFNVFLLAFFSFGGTELVGITAGESKNPSKAIPRAIRGTFWRILLFYILAIFVIGINIRNDDPSLLNSSNNNDITVSPFTLVFQRTGASAAAHIMNAVICTAVLSASNSALYASSRTLYALAKEGKAPRIFAHTSRSGVPAASVLLTAAFGAISFLGTLWGNGVVFTWLINITGVLGIITWASIILVQFRFRAAFKAQGRPLSELPYRSPLYPFGPIVALILALGIVIAEGYQAVTTTPFDVRNIIATYIGAPFFILLYVLHKLITRSKFIPLEKVDLDSDRVTESDADADEQGAPKTKFQQFLVKLWNAIA
ncbi:amino acid permease/ SLC12A domain-containing protein [Polychytrium aggregatum]|uniref:amino acid permease/ SLC12A domain-containing protein n=1 Tax=Polychytrium aggregatum TaxID=110093 RepID=UPI0022FE553A|nr:amino acid permease/ SLC12A domain-containing protein [Polychytrium aggregatum]KAI9206452.1 amino acid permease/ SLC12A domain-containing protein [Polychytrium aggregatum]